MPYLSLEDATVSEFGPLATMPRCITTEVQAIPEFHQPQLSSRTSKATLSEAAVSEQADKKWSQPTEGLCGLFMTQPT